jgi:hypothetical protein
MPFCVPAKQACRPLVLDISATFGALVTHQYEKARPRAGCRVEFKYERNVVTDSQSHPNLECQYSRTRATFESRRVLLCRCRRHFHLFLLPSLLLAKRRATTTHQSSQLAQLTRLVVDINPYVFGTAWLRCPSPRQRSASRALRTSMP